MKTEICRTLFGLDAGPRPHRTLFGIKNPYSKKDMKTTTSPMFGDREPLPRAGPPSDELPQS